MIQRKNEMDKDILLDAILNIMQEAIVVVDKNGYIWHMSKPYKEYLKINEDVIGKHVTEVIENTRMHLVLKTTKAEIAEVQNINGKELIVSRLPIIHNGKIEGVFGKVLYKDISELKELYEKVDTLKSERNFYKNKYSEMNRAEYSLEDIISVSSSMKALKETVTKVSGKDSNVLILGESGTGKELFAHALHINSKRVGSPIISLNCATIPSELMESELFGYEAGAFTGALKGGKIGLMEVAHGGTLFLDEIGDLPMPMQAKLLRVLQDRKIRRIGGNENINIDVRIIAATNKDLYEMVENKKFRDDLYYRLDVVSLKIPPLRERREDIKPLAENIVRKLNIKHKMNVKKITVRAMEHLSVYDWPGNVRELENVIERAVNFITDEPIIRTKNLPSKITGIDHEDDKRSLREKMDAAEKEFIIETLIQNNGNKTISAKKLGVSRTSLYEKMSKLEIGRDC